MNSEDLDKTLAVVARRARELREAGIVGRVTIADVSFDVAGVEPEQPVLLQSTPETQNPIDDPDTFGGHIPRRRGQNTEPEE